MPENSVTHNMYGTVIGTRQPGRRRLESAAHNNKKHGKKVGVAALAAVALLLIAGLFFTERGQNVLAAATGANVVPVATETAKTDETAPPAPKVEEPAAPEPRKLQLYDLQESQQQARVNADLAPGAMLMAADLPKGRSLKEMIILHVSDSVWDPSRGQLRVSYQLDPDFFKREGLTSEEQLLLASKRVLVLDIPEKEADESINPEMPLRLEGIHPVLLDNTVAFRAKLRYHPSVEDSISSEIWGEKNLAYGRFHHNPGQLQPPSSENLTRDRQPARDMDLAMARHR